MSESLWGVPEKWEWTTLSSLGQIVSGGTPSTKQPDYWGDDVVWFSPADLTGYAAKRIAHGAKSLSLSGLANSSAKLMPAGSVLFSSRAPIGYVAITVTEAATNQGFKSLVPNSAVFNEYAYYYLKSAKRIAEERASGTTFKEISGTAFGQLPVPLPPANEQRRIVAKIEELFTELDNGAESLKRARELLKLYRQSVLKHAFEGKLTADWRKTNKDKLGGMSEMPATWTHAPPDKLKSIGNVSELPKGWAKVTVADIASSIRYGYTASASKEPVGPRMLRITDIQDDRVNWESVPYCKIAAKKLDDFKLSAGDIVFARTGGTVGKSFIIGHVPEEAVFASYLIKISARQNTLPEYLYWFFQSGSYWEQIGLKKGGLQGNVNATALSALELPIAPLSEQRQIVAEIEQAFSKADYLASTIDNELARVEVLRQSILKKAFSGQLVPQDPADKPASALLNRIRRASAKPKLGKAKKTRES